MAIAVFQGLETVMVKNFVYVYVCVSVIYKNHSHLSSVAGGPTFYYVICDLETVSSEFQSCQEAISPASPHSPAPCPKSLSLFALLESHCQSLILCVGKSDTLSRF